MSIKEELLYYLTLFNKKPNRDIGQHFLIQRSILRREVKEAELEENDSVLDIGAGLGFLTELIAEKVKKVYAIEIDDVFVRILEERLSKHINEGRIELIHGDALKIPFPKVTKVVSNPPYHIISSLILKILREIFPYKDFKLMVLIVQEEFAYRLLAKPGSKNWGRISAAFRFFASGKIIMKVPKYAFYPIPDVNSIMIKAWPVRKQHIISFGEYEKVTAILFSSPNKKVKSVLKNYLKRSKAPWKKILSLIPQYILEKRVREVSPEEIEKIGEKIKEFTQDLQV
mgnify:CR=1 FL=1